MSSHRVPRVTRNPFNPQRTALNGKLPSATEYRRRADSFNYIAGYQKKMHLVRAMDLNAIPTPGSSSIYQSVTYFRTGEATDAIWVYAGLVKTNYAVAFGSEPTLNLNVNTAAGAAVVQELHTFNQTATSATVTPDDIHHTRVKLDSLSADTAYKLIAKLENGARLVYIMVVDERDQVLSTATTGVCDPGSCRVEGDIDDANIGKLVAANNALWRHCKAPLFTWTPDFETASAAAGVPVITATAYTDVYATDKSFTLDTRYQTTLMRTSVPVVMACLAERTAGSGTLSIRLTDGTNHIEVAGITSTIQTGAWTTATTTMPAALTTGWHLEGKASAASSWSLYGVVLFPYET